MTYECDNDNHDIGCQCPGTQYWVIRPNTTLEAVRLMKTDVHHPVVNRVETLDCEAGPFHTIDITDNTGDGRLVLFIRDDWSDWDALVAKVSEYRACASLL